MIQKYRIEFILHTQNISSLNIKNSLAEFGNNLEIVDCLDATGRGKNFKVCLDTEEPTAIFDICAQLGRIKQVKVKEE